MNGEILPSGSGSSASKKGFWDRPEGTVGMVLPAIGIVVGAILMIKYSALLLAALANTVLFFGLLAAFVAVLLVAFTDNPLRRAIWLKYTLLCRALYSMVIQSDPISVLREYQRRARKRREVIAQNRAEVGSQKKATEEVIRSYGQDFDTLNREKASYERRIQKGDSDQFVQREYQSCCARIGKLMDYGKRAQAQLDKITVFHNKLGEGIRSLEIMEKDIDFDISLLERDYKTAGALATAWRNIRAAMKGEDFMDEMKDEAVRFILEDYSAKMGRVDTWVDEVQDVITRVDNKEKMYADDAIVKMESLNGMNFNQIIKQGPTTVQPTIGYNPQPTGFVAPKPTGERTSYSQVMRK